MYEGGIAFGVLGGMSKSMGINYNSVGVDINQRKRGGVAWGIGLFGASIRLGGQGITDRFKVMRSNWWLFGGI